jgi:hypothetical protein
MMAKQVQKSVDNDAVTLPADKGYYSAAEIKKCLDDNITIVVPPIKTGQEQRNKGKFGKEKFVYDREQDGYICPNNQTIPKTYSNHTSYQRVMHLYRISSKVCQACPLKTQCLGEKTKQKQIQRWEHQQLIRDYNARMKTEVSKAIIIQRSAIVEHPFGTIKRMLNLIGIPLFKKLMIAVKAGDIEAVKVEIAEYIAAFSACLNRFFFCFGILEKRVCFR